MLRVNILVCLLTICDAGTIACEKEASCLGIRMSNNDPINCYGYRSCEDASMDVNGNHIYCTGSYSGYNASFMALTGEYIYCYGLFSCANVKSINVNQGTVLCLGEQSCINSKMIVNAASTSTIPIQCHGDRSCANSIIYAGTKVSFYGNLGGLNSVVYIENVNKTANIYFLGADSGYNTTIICGQNHTCNIYYYSNTYDLNDTKCFNSSDCSIKMFNYGIEDYLYDDAISHVGINKFALSLIDVTMSTYENSYYPCAATTAKNCADYQECQYDTSLQNANGPICCTAYFSCNEAADNITATRASSNDIGNTSIRCDGWYSCDNGKRIHGVNGNVYLAGTRSATNTIIMAGADKIYNMYCSGYRSCLSSIIKNGNNLYCSGHNGCKNAILITNINNVYGYGWRGLWNSSLTSIDNIYCGSAESCMQTRIDNIFDSIYSNNWRALWQSDISNVANNVIAVGYQAARLSSIYNVSKIYCFGEESCYGSTFRGIHKTIYINGYNAIAGYSTIISETNFDENGTLVVYINGTQFDDRFDIYCNDSDICKIACLSSKACNNLAIHCNNNCYVYCDDTAGIDCPFNTNDFIAWTIPNATTMAPSVSPTLDPTLDPSINPSIYPSIYPSNIATEMPTMENNKSNSSTVTVLDTVIIIIVITVGILLCLAMILIFVHFHRQRENEQIITEIELNKLKVAAQSVNKISDIINEKEKQKENEGRRESIFDDLQETRTRKSTFSRKDSVLEESYEMEGKETIQVTTGYENENGDENENDGNSLDYSQINEWTSKHVLIWLKKLLLENGFDKSKILTFLKEFSQKNVDGRMLTQFENDSKLLDSFITKFSKENQIFGIWLLITKEIQDISKNKQTKGN